MNEVPVIRPSIETPSKSEAASIEAEASVPETMRENPEQIATSQSELLAVTIAGEEEDLAKIQGLEQALGVKLPQVTREKTVSIDEARALESEGKERRILEEMSLNTSKILRHARDFQDSVNRLDRGIADAASQRSGFNVGKKLEESTTFVEIKNQTRIFGENASSLEHVSAMLARQDLEGNTDRGRFIDELLKSSEKQSAEIRRLADLMDQFYRGVSGLQRKISDFYNGRSNNDEDMLRRFQGQVQSTFGHLKDINRAYRDQELMLSDYQKIQQEKTRES